ncbi:MAG: polysaccharide deacetylase family protein [Nocardioides sp.]|nr:polysaccharide deacetylase family protein [Nocardioides sp.]
MSWEGRRSSCAALSLHPLRLRYAGTLVPPELLGASGRHHVALTFDDGPDTASTPYLLDVLTNLGVRATFFLLGAHVSAAGGLVREMRDAGHELAVHGWTHRAAPLMSADRLADDLARSRDLVEETTGAPVRWYRPPYGALAPQAFRAAEQAGLQPVLWTAWGRDWERRATPARVHRTLGRTLAPGGTVLLHDSDRTAAPGSWRTTLAAIPLLARSTPAPLGPLADHGLAPAGTSTDQVAGRSDWSG